MVFLVQVFCLTISLVSGGSVFPTLPGQQLLCYSEAGDLVAALKVSFPGNSLRGAGRPRPWFRSILAEKGLALDMSEPSNFANKTREHISL